MPLYSSGSVTNAQIVSAVEEDSASVVDALNLYESDVTPQGSDHLSSHTVVDIDHRKVFTNLGASGSVTFTLPTSPARGFEITVVVEAAQTVMVSSPSVNIRPFGAADITAATVGDWVRLTWSGSYWQAVGYTGFAAF